MYNLISTARRSNGILPGRRGRCRWTRPRRQRSASSSGIRLLTVHAWARRGEVSAFSSLVRARRDPVESKHGAVKLVTWAMRPRSRSHWHPDTAVGSTASLRSPRPRHPTWQPLWPGSPMQPRTKKIARPCRRAPRPVLPPPVSESAAGEQVIAVSFSGGKRTVGDCCWEASRSSLFLNLRRFSTERCDLSKGLVLPRGMLKKEPNRKTQAQRGL